MPYDNNHLVGKTDFFRTHYNGEYQHSKYNHTNKHGILWKQQRGPHTVQEDGNVGKGSQKKNYNTCNVNGEDQQVMKSSFGHNGPWGKGLGKICYAKASKHSDYLEKYHVVQHTIQCWNMIRIKLERQLGTRSSKCCTLC